MCSVTKRVRSTPSGEKDMEVAYIAYVQPPEKEEVLLEHRPAVRCEGGRCGFEGGVVV